jgi:hypothetical protein
MHDQMGDVTVVDISATRLNEDGTPGDEILSCNQKGEDYLGDNLPCTSAHLDDVGEEDAEVGPHVEDKC